MNGPEYELSINRFLLLFSSFPPPHGHDCLYFGNKLELHAEGSIVPGVDQ